MRTTAAIQYPHVELAHRYAKDVLGGRVPACKWVKLACRRHRQDLKRAKAGWSYRFDREKAQRVCRFIELMPHTKGKWAAKRPGQSNLIRLEPWQAFVVCVLFGWVHVDSGLRRFREAYIAVPRKNGKSALIAAIGNYMLAADGEHGAEVFCGATSKAQAWEVFRPARLQALAESSDGFRRTFGVEVAAESIYIPSNGSRFAPIIGKPGDGASPSCAIIDEFHEHPTSEQYDSMKTGMGAREQPLLAIITTAGEDIASPCHSLHQDAQKVLDGVWENDALFAVIFGIDEGDDWTSEDVLAKANPNIGVSVDAGYLRAQQMEAIRNPRKANVFKTKHLNVWVHARSPWMNMEAWNACEDSTLDIDDFRGVPCWMGMDLASKIDLASVARLFRRDVDGTAHWYVFVRSYIPEDRAQEPGLEHYAGWVADGHLVATEGNIIDQNRIEADILDDAGQHGVNAVAFDPYSATKLALDLTAKGVPMVEVPQTVGNLSEPMKELEALVLSGRLHHDGNPVTTWAASNVTARTDANDNVFPRKDRVENKIDPIVALINAMNRALADDGVVAESVYETRGFEFL